MEMGETKRIIHKQFSSSDFIIVGRQKRYKQL